MPNVTSYDTVIQFFKKLIVRKMKALNFNGLKEKNTPVFSEIMKEQSMK